MKIIIAMLSIFFATASAASQIDYCSRFQPQNEKKFVDQPGRNWLTISRKANSQLTGLYKHIFPGDAMAKMGTLTSATCVNNTVTFSWNNKQDNFAGTFSGTMGCQVSTYIISNINLVINGRAYYVKEMPSFPYQPCPQS